MYYAWYQRFGKRNIVKATFFAFKTKKDRDEWVSRNEYDVDNRSNIVAGPITRKDLEYYFGKFYVHSGICLKYHANYVDHEAEDNAEMISRTWLAKD